MSWLQSTVRCSGRCYCCIDERIAVGAGTAFGDVVVATKVSPGPENLDSIEQVITTQIDEGLKWLGRDHVDVIYLHHAVLNERQPERGRLAVEDVERAAQSLQKAINTGKTRCWRINGVGNTEALIEAVEKGSFPDAALENIRVTRG